LNNGIKRKKNILIKRVCGDVLVWNELKAMEE